VTGHVPLGPSPEDTSDAVLIRHVLAGDRDRYAELVRRYQAQLFRHAFGMVQDGDAAGDLVQDALVRGFTRLASCQNGDRFGSWIFRILRNRCHDHLRDLRQRTQPIDEHTTLAPERDDPEVALARAELRGALGGAIARLPDAQREAFLLKHVEGVSYQEMAEMLDVSISALKMRVMRARESLQEQLRGATASGDGLA
jgi:RNA polymerase sigma-70 factor, ECF subfamily